MHRYEDDDTELLFVSWWESVQRIDRPNKPRFRRPDGTWAYSESEIRGTLATPSRVSRDTLATGTGEQGNRGTGENPSCPSADADEATEADSRFDEFWNTYAKKVGRKKAEQRWRIALRKPGVDADRLIAAAGRYVTAQQVKGKHPEFTKDAATWLNGEHWNDEAATATTTTTTPAAYAGPIERPPDNLSPEEYHAWHMEQVARRRAASQ
ncbi:MAG: hypothetical protein QM714_02765 [Nocardioides sp.]|uniref:hypothetical protein n=1 Tax=Nocardioides sp. TaxID=35761 RepID=UPI0039E609B2